MSALLVIIYLTLTISLVDVLRICQKTNTTAITLAEIDQELRVITFSVPILLFLIETFH